MSFYHLNLTEIDRFSLTYSGQDCSKNVQRLVEAASVRFLQMENNIRDKERIIFPKKNLWKETEPEENIYKKALGYLIDKLSFTVHNQNPSPLLFRMINIIFLNKIK